MTGVGAASNLHDVNSAGDGRQAERHERAFTTAPGAVEGC